MHGPGRDVAIRRRETPPDEVGVRTEPDDASVIARSLEEPEAFAAIFERHFDEIHRYLRRRHPPDADELAAEVFIIAFDARNRFRSDSASARPWLYGIASHVLSRRRRAERRALRAHARRAGRAAGGRDEYAEADARADAQRRSAAVAAAVAGLPDADRDTLLLYALSDLTYEEVAQALDVPVGTVRSRLARARSRAAAALGEPRPQEHDDA
jgi:RNA polymerase sigma factor (sigma-70 family)